MTDVIFDAKKDSKDVDQVSKDTLQSKKEFFNNLQYKALVGLRNYFNVHGEWPTARELSRFIGQNKDNIKPRLSALQDMHVVFKNGKRECSVSDNSISVNTFKLRDDLQ